LNLKILNLNQAFQSGNLTQVLSVYEILLLLRCLEYYLKNLCIPNSIDNLVENLKKENLLLLDPIKIQDEDNVSIIQNYIESITNLSIEEMQEKLQFVNY
jgi:hypothetical protein